jgi:hypothetical protein
MRSLLGLLQLLPVFSCYSMHQFLWLHRNVVYFLRKIQILRSLIRMILQKIRNYLPQGIRTEEQDLLIGDTCLALTDKEREEIENLNFENYYYNSPQRAEISAKIADAVHKAQLVAVRVLGGGSTTCKTTNSLPMTALARAAGSLLGSISGYYAGENLGHAMVVTDTKNSPEYRKWENEKYQTIIFPALSRYMNPNQWEDFQLLCPITLGFMLEPVQAIDNHIYDKSAILTHLATWQERWNSWDRQCLPAERQIDLWRASSPFRAAYITANTLKPLPNYYRNIFYKLVHNYNSKVLAQQFIVDLAKENFGPLTKEAEKIVKLYKMTQRQRTRVDGEIGMILLNKDEISDEDLEESREFLSAAAKLPRKLILAG